MLTLSGHQVASLISMSDAVEAVRAAYRDVAAGSAVVADRSLTRLPEGWMRILPGGWPARGVFGFKEFHLFAGAVRHTTTLFDAADGRPLCMLDANPLTAIRTGATAAVAADHLAPPGPADVAVVGSGKEAVAALTAFACVRPLRSVTVFSPRAASRQRFCDQLRTEHGIEVRAAETVITCIEPAQIVLAATAAGSQVAIPSAAAAHVAHVTSIGATLPEHRELDAALLHSAELLAVDTEQLLVESGDTLNAGCLAATRVVELAEVVRGNVQTNGQTIFKSLGSGLQDIAVAEVVYRRATASAVGSVVPDVVAARRLNTP